MTGGRRWGLSGDERRALGWGAVLTAGIVALIIGVNILTRLHDDPRHRLAAVVDEGSSFVTVLLATTIPAAIALWMRRRRPGLAAVAAAILAGFCGFVTVHVGGFIALRHIAFPLLGHPYAFGPLATQLPYEAMKDVLGYGLAVASFWRLLAWRSAPPDAPPPAPAVFDIQDGARWVRAPVAEILAVRSAGNYVEFLLADGRRPLMRTPLGALEAKLRPQGFVRTHRSWLVNAALVTGLKPEGSGDHTIELGLLEAPLSRRYREALDAIRP